MHRATSVAALVSLLVLNLDSACRADGIAGYYRYPAIHADTVIFTAEGNLWKVGVKGGTAQLLTTHAGEESHAAISPDGKWLAFSASYEGPTEAYVMPLAGGLPKRLTYHGDGATVAGWTPDGRVLYSTRHYATLPDVQLVAVDPATRAGAPLPLSQCADGSYDTAGTLYFTRLAFQGSHTRRYKGGEAQNIWKFARGAKEAVPLTSDYAGTSKSPMVWKDRVYFSSDRDGTMELWSMRPDGKDLKQLTNHAGWDVQSPNLEGGRIVYQLGADLYLYDISTGKDQKLDIAIVSDLDQAREKWITKPMEYLTSGHISPNGDRVVLTARGQVFVAPVKDGRLVEATRKRNVRYRDARFSGEGKSLVVLSDESGETEYWRLPANGVGPSTRLSEDAKVLRMETALSPDGRWIAYGNKDQELWVFDTTTRQSKKIASSASGRYQDLAWSPDNTWLAYVEPTATFVRVGLYSTADGKTTIVTSGRSDAASPAWSRDGKWLYFLADRTFQSAVDSPWGPRQPEPFFDKQSRIYALALQKGLRSPFLPADELHPAEVKEEKPRAAGDERPAAVKVDLDGIQARQVQVPVPAGNYDTLSVNGSRLYYISRGVTPDQPAHLMSLDIANHDIAAKTFVDGITMYELSQDGKRLLVRKADTLFVLDAGSSAPASLDKKAVDLSGWAFSIDPREEWRQMFAEAWRLHRDYFYDRGMHGVDWPAALGRYRPLLDRVTDREELSDLLGQLMGELSALHTFVVGGDMRRGQERVQPGSLGAELVRDPQAGGYRVTRIFQADPDYPETLSPLARPDVDARVGDVIRSINGVDILTVSAPEELLRNQAGKQVLLRVKPAAGDERDVIVTPMSTQRAFALRYDDWELSRRRVVEEAGKGDIGYVHLRAMGAGDIAQWVRDYYPVFNRSGLIIDVRHNGGGNIDSWILEKLLRKAWFFWQPRVGSPTWNMQWAFRGHVVVLCDEHTGSDGEAFTEGIKRLNLGKVIGTRTWGGEIWLTMSNTLVDHGMASAAEIGVYGPEGKWLIEGHGVEPDVVVDNLPHATFEGRDAQLESAIAYLQKQINDHPIPIPPAPAYPNKAAVPPKR